MRAAAALFSVALASAVACRSAPSSDPPDPSTSPQAKAEPAPIASAIPPAPTATGSVTAIRAPQPVPMRPDEAAPLEPLPVDGGHDGAAHEAVKPPAVYTVLYALHGSDAASAPKGVELSPSGVDAARRKSEPSLSVDLTPGHARAVLHDGFVLHEGTELRIRADRYGYVVLPPGGERYRVAATGSLRALLGEGLFHVAPSSAAEVVDRGEGARRLGKPTRRVEVSTRAAKASFELARFPDAGDGGALTCRIWLDLMSTLPSATVCAEGEVPLHVEYRWSAQGPVAAGARARASGVTVIDAVSADRRTDLSPSSLSAPPPTAMFVATGEPVSGSHLFLSRSDLAALRVDRDAPHPGEAAALLSLHNSTDELRYVWLDGVPLAWLAPGGRLDVSGVPHARATLQWRTFLGDAIDAAETVTLPATVDASSQAIGRGAVSAADNPPP